MIKEIPKLNPDKIIDTAKLDKKTKSGIPEYALVKTLGHAEFGIKVTDDIVKQVILNR